MSTNGKSIESLAHHEASRANIPSAEHESVLNEHDHSPIQVEYDRRQPDLDPQLIWRGKTLPNEKDTLVVQAPHLFIQEKVHPKALIDDLQSVAIDSTANQESTDPNAQIDLFQDFDLLPTDPLSAEFYKHDSKWSNRMILGDSLRTMASLAGREKLRGQVQCVYIDPPYGIKFNSNFQWSSTSRVVKDGNLQHISREPEQVKAFRDTWRDGIHSYLTFLRDRLTVVRELLSDSGSVFVQIGDANVHRVRSVMDEVFGEKNFVSLITFRTSSGTSQENSIKAIANYIVWYSKDISQIKFRRLLERRQINTSTYNQLMREDGTSRPMTPQEKRNPSECPKNHRPYRKLPVHSMASGNHEHRKAFNRTWRIPASRSWRYAADGFDRLIKASRIYPDRSSLSAVYYHEDYSASELLNVWTDTGPEIKKSYVVQTSIKPIQRCILMTTDPGDIVLDPTCGSGTTAYVAEQWGRRWIVIDTSRVALILARARIMGACFPYYYLLDSTDGQKKEAEVSKLPPPPPRADNQQFGGSIRQGFVYERVRHITLESIANNTELDVIWDQWKDVMDPLRAQLNECLDQEWEEWEIPRKSVFPWPSDAMKAWNDLQNARSEGKRQSALDRLNRHLKRSYLLESVPDHPGDCWEPGAVAIHRKWWHARIARQREIDAAINSKAEFEYFYDSPYEDSSKVRVAGPFTVESLSPHRVMDLNEDDELIDRIGGVDYGDRPQTDFASMVLEHLATAGVHQSHKEDHISFTAINPWPGDLICSEGFYQDKESSTDSQKRAAVLVGPEFGTVSRSDLAAAAREAGEAGFDVLVACAFNFDSRATDFHKLGRIPILKARMNADLHMGDDLRNTGKGNLFVVFGEPDIEIISDTGTTDSSSEQIRIRIKGVDVYHPNTGEIHSDGPDGIACWFIDTNYNEESFFIRHAYFLGAKDNYNALKKSLRAEISKEAWDSLNSDTSRLFEKPSSGRIAVKVINHLGDEVMKVFRV